MKTANKPPANLGRRGFLVHTTTALSGMGAALCLPAQAAAGKVLLRISTPAVPDDWHAKMWTVFKEHLEHSAPGEFEVQINLNAALFKQGAEPAAMARGNLELSSVSAFDIAKQVPEFSIFTAGYVVRDPAQQQNIFNGPVGTEMFQRVSERMDITPLATAYLGTRQLNLRDERKVTTPADLKGVKLRMPGSKDWLFLGSALGATPTPLAFGEVYMGLKSGTIDAQDNPLPTVRAAKFYEVTRQIVLTSHLVDSLYITMANKALQAMTPAQQQKVRAAAQAAVLYNNENRIKEEVQLIDFFKKQGLQVSTPDVPAFRKAVQLAYQQSDYAKVWPNGLLARINAVR
jgi:tripartite ATP-independent transporter DctP family solute receptor